MQKTNENKQNNLHWDTNIDGELKKFILQMYSELQNYESWL